MILRDRPSGFQLFFIIRGSILTRIWRVLLVNVVLATLVTWSDGDIYSRKITLTAIPFTLIGLPLAIFLGFRNTAAYDRYVEGRKLWGEIVLRSRNLARQCLSLIPAAATEGQLPPVGGGAATLADLRGRMVYRTIAYVHALRHQLRDTDAQADLRGLLRPVEWQQAARASRPAEYLMQQMGQDLRECLARRALDGCLAATIDGSLSALVSAAASCERIKGTPIPFSYSLMLHRTAYLYCFLLPFGLVDTTGFMTPFVVGIVAYTFFVLEALGDEIEEPFGNSPNDLALDAISRSAEISLRDALGEDHGLQPLQPVDFCLT